eukprot:c16471_g1_i2.p1 GENE.c16471_g1_i2~~c16471_g1_i2.p1  ORF type:complete len:571 (-),score=106.81 c16471_g1_i2:99-1811(-)
MTICGHSYCHDCITKYLDQSPKCPVCARQITAEQVFPNYALNQLLERLDKDQPEGSDASTTTRLQKTITHQGMSICDINELMQTLKDKKRALESTEQAEDLDVLAYFLETSRSSKLQTLDALNTELGILNRDIQSVGDRRKELDTHKRQRDDGDTPADDSQPVDPNGIDGETGAEAKRRRVLSHLSDLQACYFDAHSQLVPVPKQGTDNPAASNSSVPQTCESPTQTADPTTEIVALTTFSTNLNTFTKFSEFQTISCFFSDGSMNARPANQVISSIETDKYGELFATASAKISLFEMREAISEEATHQYPVHELGGEAKFSCLSWNPYIKAHLASSDYNGGVTLWNTSSCSVVNTFAEHKQRVWSVHFSRTDPKCLASGSDDKSVRIWATDMKQSVMNIPQATNVCCVQFHPSNTNFLACSRADHLILYYDLRNTSTPLVTLDSHTKAVSYVKFISDTEIISASTDNTLKLWSITTGDCLRTYSGHTNKKNFVGLVVHQDFIVCGSEDNSVVAYFKTLSTPAIRHDFSDPNSVENPNAPSFVSALCWKPKSNILLAANSRGLIKALKLS